MRQNSYVAVTFALLMIPGVLLAEQVIDQPRYRVAKDGDKRVIIVTFSTNFLAAKGSADAVATDSAGNTTTIPSTNIELATIENIVVPPRSRFEARIKYAPPVEQAATLRVNVRAFEPSESTPDPVSANTAPAANTPAAVASTTFDMQPVHDYFALLKQSDDLQTQMRNMAPIPPPPVITADIVSIADRSIKLRAKSSKFVRVRAYAFQTTDPAQTLGVTDLKSDDVILYDDIWRDMSIPNLSEKTNYIITVRESAQPQGRAPAVITHYQGQPLKTADPIPRPYVAFSGPPANKRNQELALRVTTSNVAKIRATVFNDTTADKTEVAREVEIAVSPSALPVTVTVPLPTPLRAGQTYRVSVRGIPTNALVDPTELITSEPVAGLPDKLFDTVSLSATTNALKFTPLGSSEPIKLSVLTTMNGVTYKKDCPVPAQCELPVADLPKPPVPQAGTTAPSTSPTGQSQLIFQITATTTDTSERTQTATYALALGNPTTATSTASKDTKKKVRDFVAGLTTTTNQNSGIQAQNIKGSSVATWVAVLLKAFFGI